MCFAAHICGTYHTKVGVLLAVRIRYLFCRNWIVFCWKMLRSIYEKVQLRGSLLPGALGVLLCTITINMNSSVNLRLGLYGNGVWFLVNAIVMTLPLYLLWDALSKYDNFVKEMSFSGKNSIVYLGLNQLILMFFKNCC